MHVQKFAFAIVPILIGELCHPDRGPMRSTYLLAEPVTRTLVAIA